MEEMILNDDIKVGFVTAATFPAGVMDAHRSLHTLVPFSANRKYFGVSRPENGTIVYRAAVELTELADTKPFQTSTLVIRKGKYISATINDFMKDIQSIGRTFQDLLKYPGLDPQGYCIEWYLGERDVRCMIRLADR
jgi:predicted transcriptional regulator YdeE